MKRSNRESTFISAVFYIHDDEVTLEKFFLLVQKQLSEHFQNFEIICVDDACSDNSCAVIRQAASALNAETILTIVHMGYYHGVEAAMRAGVGYAIGDFVFEFDSMLPDFPESLIYDVYQHAMSGFDMVSAVPSAHTQRSSNLFYAIFNRFFANGSMQTERFRIISRRMINRILSLNTSIPYRKAAYRSSGLHCDALSFIPLERETVHQDKATESMRSEMAVNTLILYTDIAYRISLTLSILMAAISLFSILYTLIIFISGHPIAGWTTTMLLLSTGFFGMFLIFSILIKYVSIIVQLLSQRQSYVVADIEKITGIDSAPLQKPASGTEIRKE